MSAVSSPPTEKQYNYAWKIAHALKVELPEFFDKFSFMRFINRYKPEYDEHIKLCREAYEEAKYEQMIQDSLTYNE